MSNQDKYFNVAMQNINGDCPDLWSINFVCDTQFIKKKISDLKFKLCIFVFFIKAYLFTCSYMCVKCKQSDTINSFNPYIYERKKCIL